MEVGITRRVLSQFQQIATTARRSSLLRTVELFTLDARAQYHVHSSDVNPAIAEPVSSAERSSAWRSVARAGTVEQRADEHQQPL